jgi:Domain of unknown function (DUF4430)
VRRREIRPIPAPSRLAVLLLALAALGGCAGGPADSPQQAVGLAVTRDFGRSQMLARDRVALRGADTVVGVLRRNARVGTRSGGFVQEINGVEGGRRDGRPLDWFVYVNGIGARKGARAVEVHGGDRLWWDHHDWGVTADIPAVVGSFPEPFLHGTDGKRLPVRVECDDPRAGACGAVADKLIEFGVPAGRSSLSRSAADESLRVLVGTWQRLRGRDAESDSIDAGPRSSGVYARFDKAGAQLDVLDAQGRVARTLGPGTGFIAATRATDRQPVWFVTGTDEAGVQSAARAFDESALGNRFALAISGDLPVSVPLP